MADFFDEINLLVNDIIEHNISKDDVIRRIGELKARYGNDAFPSIHFQKKPKPWDKGYFLKLKEMNITGACSEEFLIHMAEVGEEIAVKRKRLMIGVIIAVAVIALIIILLLI